MTGEIGLVECWTIVRNTSLSADPARRRATVRLCRDDTRRIAGHRFERFRTPFPSSAGAG
ncbi:MAG: hypothetical protein GXY46_03675 [Actinobacteria bacterium]|nr:hypothetical protein [Actinomycetota bacterium]